MKFSINFGEDKTLFGCFDLGTMWKIERRGMDYLKNDMQYSLDDMKALGILYRGAVPTGTILNMMNQGGMMKIVLEEVLRAGGNVIGGKDGLNVDELVDEYTEKVDDIFALNDQLIKAFENSRNPRAAAKTAEAVKAAKLERETKAKGKHGKTSSGSESETSG